MYHRPSMYIYICYFLTPTLSGVGTNTITYSIGLASLGQKLISDNAMNSSSFSLSLSRLPMSVYALYVECCKTYFKILKEVFQMRKKCFELVFVANTRNLSSSSSLRSIAFVFTETKSYISSIDI